jgi:hypothetical protein
MSELITGNHLEPEDLAEVLGDGANIRHELGHFGEWAEKKKFDSLMKGIEKCRDKDRDRKVRPILKKLGYENKVCNFHAKWHGVLTPSSLKSNIKSSVLYRESPSRQVRVTISYLYA